ncbi:hypothetical protein HT031_005248 [Scenedesmus sp. PABB004]|nr:hypothetical protein HT031_005248 [Scenedesmus sp. PABB004]
MLVTTEGWDPVDRQPVRGELHGVDRAQSQAADLVTVALSGGAGCVTLKQNPTALRPGPGGGVRVGAAAWDGAFVLAALLDGPRRGGLAGARVVELGAGMGLAGLAAARLGAAHVWLTDKPAVTVHARVNAAKSGLGGGGGGGRVSVLALDWEDPASVAAAAGAITAGAAGGGVDLLLASDCVYPDPDGSVPSAEGLLAAMRALAAPGRTRALVTFEARGDALRAGLLAAAAAAGAAAARLPPGELAEGWAPEHVEVYELALHGRHACARAAPSRARARGPPAPRASVAMLLGAPRSKRKLREPATLPGAAAGRAARGESDQREQRAADLAAPAPATGPGQYYPGTSIPMDGWLHSCRCGAARAARGQAWPAAGQAGAAAAARRRAQRRPTTTATAAAAARRACRSWTAFAATDAAGRPVPLCRRCAPKHAPAQQALGCADAAPARARAGQAERAPAPGGAALHSPGAFFNAAAVLSPSHALLAAAAQRLAAGGGEPPSGGGRKSRRCSDAGPSRGGGRGEPAAPAAAGLAQPAPAAAVGGPGVYRSLTPASHPLPGSGSGGSAHSSAPISQALGADVLGLLQAAAAAAATPGAAEQPARAAPPRHAWPLEQPLPWGWGAQPGLGARGPHALARLGRRGAMTTRSRAAAGPTPAATRQAPARRGAGAALAAAAEALAQLWAQAAAQPGCGGRPEQPADEELLPLKLLADATPPPRARRRPRRSGSPRLAGQRSPDADRPQPSGSCDSRTSPGAATAGGREREGEDGGAVSDAAAAAAASADGDEGAPRSSLRARFSRLSVDAQFGVLAQLQLLEEWEDARRARLAARADAAAAREERRRRADAARGQEPARAQRAARGRPAAAEESSEGAAGASRACTPDAAAARRNNAAARAAGAERERSADASGSVSSPDNNRPCGGADGCARTRGARRRQSAASGGGSGGASGSSSGGSESDLVTRSGLRCRRASGASSTAAALARPGGGGLPARPELVKRRRLIAPQRAPACALAPAAAAAAFGATSGAHACAYALLLSCLADGRPEAGQLLLLLQLHHEQAPRAGGSGLAWPDLVVGRLSALAVDAQHEPAIAVMCLRLLAVAAAALAGPGAAQALPPGLLAPIAAAAAAAGQPPWLERLGAAGVAALAALATHACTLQLRALASTDVCGADQLAPGLARRAAPCCQAGFVVLDCVAALARECGAALAAEPGVARGLHALVARLIEASPQQAARQLDWSGRQSGFRLVPAPAEPCSCRAVAPGGGAERAAPACAHAPAWAGPGAAAAAAAAAGAPPPGSPQRTLLGAALRALCALCDGGGRAAASALYAADVSASLERLRGFAGSREVLAAAQALYGRLCLASPQLRGEVLQEGPVVGLAGLLRVAAAAAPRTGAAAGLQAAALQRLVAAMDAAPAAEVLWFVGASQPAGGAPAGAAAPASPEGHAAAVAARSGSGLAAVVAALLAPAQQPRSRAAAAQAFLAALDRCRRMQRLGAAQAPRGGVWSQLGGAAVRALESLAGAPQAPAAAPHAAARADGGPSAAEPGAGAAVAPAPAGGARAGAASGSPGRRRTGGARPAAAGSGSNALAGGDSGGYDEDGLREVWSSGPSPAAAAARCAWRRHDLGRLLTWSQSAADLDVRLLLPADTRRRDVAVSIAPDRLTVRLAWAGRVLDAPLAQRVKPSEACWSLEGVTVDLGAAPAGGGQRGAGGAAVAGGGGGSSDGGAERFIELLLLLPKEVGGRYWRALFEGGPEKSHLEVLAEAVSNEDDARAAPSVDELGPEAAALLEELRDRQAALSGGELDLERGFDDFRLVLGDATM